MKKRMWIFAAAAAVSFGVAADPVKDRQQDFKTFGKAMKAIKGVVQAGAPAGQAELQKAVQMLKDASESQWKNVDARFVAGTHGGKTEALLSIWEKPEEFKAAIKKNIDAIDGLHSAAQSADPAAWGKAFGAVGGSCKNCHDSFKKAD